MSARHLSAALLTLVFAATATASVAQAASQRRHDPAWSAGTSHPVDDPPWSFACIKDHGTSRCNDLN
jgi:ABC-type sugar transport system substrate-binding protein